MLRTLALDIGDKRIGVALSDPRGTIATPHSTIQFDSVDFVKRKLKYLIKDYEIEHILVGLPLSLDGSQGRQARHVKELSKKILTDIALPMSYYDERLSSVQATNALAEAGALGKDARSKVDMVAASLFLQAWLDSNNAQ